MGGSIHFRKQKYGRRWDDNGIVWGRVEGNMQFLCRRNHNRKKEIKAILDHQISQKTWDEGYV